MFTGIVTDIGSVVSVETRNDIRRIAISSHYERDSIDIGASISCAGICLTAISRERDAEGLTIFEVEAGPETIALTTLDRWDIGTRVNLERSLRIGDELGGHLVSGHVDGIAAIVERKDMGETTLFTLEAPAPLARFIAQKGSVALDGTSLTVTHVDGRRFAVMLIPHSLQVTTWNERRAGDPVNLEIDQIARYVARLAQAG